MTIRGRAGFATWFSRVSPEERGFGGVARQTHGSQRERPALDAAQARGAGGRFLAVILRNRRARRHCLYLMADIPGKYTQSFVLHRRSDPGSARRVAIGIQLHLRNPKFTSELLYEWQIGLRVNVNLLRLDAWTTSTRWPGCWRSKCC